MKSASERLAELIQAKHIVVFRFADGREGLFLRNGNTLKRIGDRPTATALLEEQLQKMRKHKIIK